MKKMMQLGLVAWLGLGMTLRSDTPPEYGRGFDVYTTSSTAVLAGDTLFATWPPAAKKEKRFLVSIDVSDPAAPKLLDRLELDGFPQDLALHGTTLYGVNGRDFLTVDVSDPAALRLQNTLRISDDPMHGPQGVAVDGNIAWLACRRGGIRAVNLAAPGGPKILAAVDAPAFLRGVAIRDRRLYAAGDTRGVFVFDISNPEKPELRQRVPAPAGCIGRIRLHGDVAYLAGGNVLAAVLSLADPDRPEWMGATEERGLMSPFFGCNSHDLAVMPREASETGAPFPVAAVADGEGGLILVDLSRPAQPRFLSAVLSRGLGGAYQATGLALKGSTVFLIDQSYGLRIVDISNPSSPRPIGEGLKL